MPSNEVKHRKGKSGVAPNGETSDAPKQCCRDEAKKDGVSQPVQNNSVVGRSCVRCSLTLDLKTVVSFLSLSTCFVLAWVVVQQNARFIEVEEKYRYLYEKSSDLLVLEEKLSEVSKKLDDSEVHLKGALSPSLLLTRLEHDVVSLNNDVAAIQEDQNISSHWLQSTNKRFLNVTETWQGNLASVSDGLAALRSESRSVHRRVAESINKAEGHLRALTERLEELEDSTRRNSRVLERTEEDDTRRVQEQLDWNTGQVVRLREQFALLSRHDAELEEKLDETVPRAQECAAHLPAVEEAVKSILRLSADLSAVQERMEEITLQVLGTEDSMLKALGQILELRQGLGELHMASVMKANSKLRPIVAAVEELGHMQTEQGLHSVREGPRLDEGKDFEKDDIADLEVEYIRQLYDGVVEQNGFPESALDNSDGQSIEAEEHSVTK
ncbi:LOW QUALITY PROTEIN: inhibitor of nuclear factor kappa-B kinase-interacting protein [Electrophorus electricus]|uniref:LOW QUALITY PROTEIN: inhibitor of nuclear factor kappa-B kinase-interacting protein n=1 Tax=Electrophorus electricus TaxID=8005 RepID=UPI0015D028CD|nr:LOW QUALITY PROTEIN: inhibitor of nuclear factor kappa-B kinase-interacting protein [Electrophorus electricus]